jgi:hypothetical protein
MLGLSVARKVFFSGCHHGDLQSFIDKIMKYYDKFIVVAVDLCW